MNIFSEGWLRLLHWAVNHLHNRIMRAWCFCWVKFALCSDLFMWSIKMNVFCDMSDSLPDWKGQKTKYALTWVTFNVFRLSTSFVRNMFHQIFSKIKYSFYMSHLVPERRRFFPGDPQVRCTGMFYQESSNALESLSPTPGESVWNKGVSFYLCRAFIILHPTTDLCHGNPVSLLHCWFQSGPEGLVS